MRFGVGGVGAQPQEQRGATDGAHVLRLRGRARQLPALLAEAVQPAHGQLVAERRRLRRAIKGREPRAVVREVDRCSPAEPARDAAAVAEEPLPQPSRVDPGAEIEALGIGEGGGEVEAARGIADITDRPVGVGIAAERECRGEREPRASPLGEQRREGQEGAERALGLEPHVVAEEGAPLATRQEAKGRGVPVVAQVTLRG